ncbi:hypothetical protein AYI70_g2461 [Smittium culicis]|uniref:Uncharacterized protein n=1 Tax=Smittium culicis TaxID=133412 RepID=A0A1R1XI18_9FUNG|nr:hypothetical protein AYI70_g11169 [Smittium culicis]OMJ14279.1 hypothetical protein AYI70_g7984 [Smittium culicis]OMJ23113.1 hypothetical protein AYI70_g2461 [Smittium culicis]
MIETYLNNNTLIPRDQVPQLKLNLSVRNNNNIPINNANIVFSFNTSATNNVSLPDHSISEPTSLTWCISKSQVDSHHLKFDLKSSSFDLPPLNTFKSSSIISLSTREQIPSKIDLCFPSPGSTNPLIKSNSFSLYLIYQFNRYHSEFLLEKCSDYRICPNTSSFQITLLKIRNLFSISQSLGIPKNSFCYLDPTSNTNTTTPRDKLSALVFTISQISSDCSLATCNWLLPESLPTSSTYPDLIRSITTELSDS